MLCSWLQILVLNTDTQDLVASFRVTTGTSNTTAIKSIEFARKGRWEPAGGLASGAVDVLLQSWIPVRSLPLSLTELCCSAALWRSCFLINTADRIIRVYDGREILTCGRDGEPEPMQKLQDLVNRYCRPDRSRQEPTIILCVNCWSSSVLVFVFQSFQLTAGALSFHSSWNSVCI